jgi:peptidyl-prolyl cis-trans isomerase SurA
MKFFKKNLFFIILFFFIIKSEISYSIIKNEIILKVGKEIVTSFELENKIKTILLFSNQEQNQENINKTKNSAVKFLIDKKLMLEELKKYDFDIDKTNIDKYLKNISSSFEISIPDLKKLFETNKIDFNLYVDEIKINLTWQKFIYEIYSNKVSIDENQITYDLNRILKQQKDIEEFELAEIEVDLIDNSKKEDLINEIKNSIVKFGFEKAANTLSESQTALSGGNLGWVNSASLSKEILIKIKNLNAGEISQPILIVDKILFIKMINKRKVSSSEDVDLEKLKNNLINSKTNQMFDMHSKNHLSKKRNLTIIKFTNE